MKTIELVAPAGTFESLEAAYDHGADAVYIGIGSHNLRTHAPSMDITQLAEALHEAHRRGKRLYAALNCMPPDSQLDKIEILIREMARLDEQPDAVIVSDAGVLSVCKEFLSGVKLHLSTQTGCFNSRGAAFWKSQGISRVILPRELTLEQIALITARGGCDTEVFVHGAMCMSVSGRCLLGLYLSGRHPNLGDCPQPCRLRYRIRGIRSDGCDTGADIDVEEDESGVYLLNARDLNSITILDRIAATGVSAIKIEGRNKSVHYVSSVVKTYRLALDEVLSNPSVYAVDPSWTTELDLPDHRPYTTGFYTSTNELQSVDCNKTESSVRVVGVVKAVLDAGRVVVDVKNPFAAGDILNVLPVSSSARSFDVTFDTIASPAGEKLERALSNRVVVCAGTARLRTGDILRTMLCGDEKKHT